MRYWGLPELFRAPSLRDKKQIIIGKNSHECIELVTDDRRKDAGKFNAHRSIL